MRRVKRGMNTQIRRKKILSLRKRTFGTNSHLFRFAKQQVIALINFSYDRRRERKRYFRSLCVARLRRAIQCYLTSRQTTLSSANYSSFVYSLRQTKCLLTRKVVAQLALRDALFFEKIVMHVTTSL